MNTESIALLIVSLLALILVWEKTHDWLSARRQALMRGIPLSEVEAGIADLTKLPASYVRLALAGLRTNPEWILAMHLHPADRDAVKVQTEYLYELRRAARDKRIQAQADVNTQTDEARAGYPEAQAAAEEYLHDRPKGATL